MAEPMTAGLFSLSILLVGSTLVSFEQTWLSFYLTCIGCAWLGLGWRSSLGLAWHCSARHCFALFSFAWFSLAWLSLAWLGLNRLGLAWLSLVWLGLNRLGLAWLDLA